MYSKIKKIEKIGKEKTYDIEMPFPNNYVANKMVVHNSGQAQVYVNRAQEKEEIKPFHPLLTDITQSTKGIVLYQEQVMKIMFEIGKMSWATAEMSRKVMTKSKGKDAFNKYRSEFVNNAHKFNNMAIEEAEKLFDVVSTFGSYSFNLAHAVEYSIISYQCAWLKYYHPQAFFTSLLKNESDKTSIFNYLQDAKNNGIQIEYPNINISKENYSIHNGKIYAGLDSVNGIASRTAKKIIENQPYLNYDDFVKKTKVADKILKGLIVADAFRDFAINKKEKFENSIGTTDFTEEEHTKLIYEYTTLRPSTDIKKTFNFGNYDFVNINELPNFAKKQKLIRGLVTEVLNKDKLLRGDLKDHTHHFEQHMIYLNINDGTGDVAVQINPWTYEKYSNELLGINKKAVLILGMVNKDGKKIYGDMLQIVGETYDIDKLEEDKKNKVCITSAQPALSKKKKSYYRILLSDNVEGLCFRFKDKLFPGMQVEYQQDTKPFVNIKVIENAKAISV